MKILLIAPPCFEIFQGLRPSAPKTPPLGIAYIAAVLEKNDFTVEILDTFALELTWKEIIDAIKNSDAVIFGITCITATLKEVIFISKIVKKFHPTSIVITGGAHPTVDAENMASIKSIDIVVRGEGELTVKELVELCVSEYDTKKLFHEQSNDFFLNLMRIDGICFQNKESKLHTTKNRNYINNLDELPLPAYHLLPMSRYKPPSKFPHVKPFTTIITTRGCPYRCTFCSVDSICGRKLRERSVENIEKELILLKQTYKIKNIWISDSTFTINKKRTRKICRILSELDIKWVCNTRANEVDPGLLKIMKASGCNVIEFGFESGLEENLKILKKDISVQEILNASKWTRQAGILISGDFIIGIPGDTVESVKRSLKMARKINPDFFTLSILTPYPGTEIYTYAKENGLLRMDFKDYTSPKYFNPAINLPTIKSTELVRLWTYGNIRFYIRIKYILNALKNISREISLIKSIMNDIYSAFIIMFKKIF